MTAELRGHAGQVTVTYLQMTEPPKLPRIILPSGTQIVHAKSPTTAFYRFLYHEVGDQWVWTDRKRMNDDQLKSVLHDPMVEINVLWVDGVPAGFSELRHHSPVESELSYFGLVPTFIGQGLGRAFLTWTVERAWTAPINRLTVHTCTLDHPNALENYKRRGFVPYRVVNETW